MRKILLIALTFIVYSCTDSSINREENILFILNKELKKQPNWDGEMTDFKIEEYGYLNELEFYKMSYMQRLKDLDGNSNDVIELRNHYQRGLKKVDSLKIVVYSFEGIVKYTYKGLPKTEREKYYFNTNMELLTDDSLAVFFDKF